MAMQTQASRHNPQWNYHLPTGKSGLELNSSLWLVTRMQVACLLGCGVLGDQLSLVGVELTLGMGSVNVAGAGVHGLHVVVTLHVGRWAMCGSGGHRLERMQVEGGLPRDHVLCLRCRLRVCHGVCHSHAVHLVPQVL